MTQDKARAALRAFVAVGGLEPLIAERPWEAVPGGWWVRERFAGWRFRLELAAGGVRVVMSARGGEPAVWFVAEPFQITPTYYETGGPLARAVRALLYWRRPPRRAALRLRSERQSTS